MIDANDKAKIEYGRDFDAVLDALRLNRRAKMGGACAVVG